MEVASRRASLFRVVFLRLKPCSHVVWCLRVASMRVFILACAWGSWLSDFLLSRAVVYFGLASACCLVFSMKLRRAEPMISPELAAMTHVTGYSVLQSGPSNND